jgi:hypothetical protein
MNAEAPSVYSKSIPFSGDIDAAFAAAANVLGANGFVLHEKGLSRVEFDGPGMRSSRQNPLLGASHLRMEARAGTLSLDAELGGVDTMRRFLIYFPLAMAAGFFVLIGLGGGFLLEQLGASNRGEPVAREGFWLLLTAPLALLPFAPWLILSPLMCRAIRRRTIEALDRLLAHIANAAAKPVPT